ncbi:MAG TPA: EfeM/EfeO family lipoprotein [Solirubrobacteraceae bacterium]|nr:EfeM/EfeO family lipoprotein [Solirubrobacteraceae bacterium]
MRWSRLFGAGLAALTIGGCGGGSANTTSGSSASKPPSVVRVSYDGATCAPEWSALKPGGYEFVLQDRGNDVIGMTLLNASDGTPVSPTTPVTPGERASIQAHLDAGGSYEWRCQTASQAPATSVAIQIPGSGTAASMYAPAAVSIVQLYQPLAVYTQYVSATLAKLRGQLATLQTRLDAGDVAGAQSAWVTAHVSWLALGQDDGAYGAFGNLGNQIDGTADGDVGTTSSPSFTGFHRVELDLWRRHDVAAARTDAATLAKLVSSIDQQTLSQDLPDTTVALDSWVLRCHEILEDALRDTLSGDDDYGSHTGLASIEADVTATREMLHVLTRLIAPRAPGLVQTATAQLAAIDETIGPPRRIPIVALPELSRQRIDGDVDAALETLAPVSELMQISTANS